MNDTPDMSGQYDASPEPELQPATETLDPISGEPVEQPAIVRLMGSMQGLIGGIDSAIYDQVGKPLPFVLIVFEGHTAAHCTNFHDHVAAMEWVKHFADNLAKQGD